MSLQAAPSGLSDTYIDALSQRALHSHAVNHPYIKLLSTSNNRGAKKIFNNFALQYGLYSARFVHYVSAVINNLEHPKHREILQQNLDEEYGNAHDADLPPEVLITVIGQPHSLLFARFQQAVGVDENQLSGLTESSPGAVWAKQFEALCQESALVGIGALGFGTELIVSSIYQKILSGIKASTLLTPQEYVFFDLHADCDDEHAQQFLDIAAELAANDDQAKRQIEYGMTQALALRCEFWDKMLAVDELS